MPVAMSASASRPAAARKSREKRSLPDSSIPDLHLALLQHVERVDGLRGQARHRLGALDGLACELAYLPLDRGRVERRAQVIGEHLHDVELGRYQMYRALQRDETTAERHEERIDVVEAVLHHLLHVVLRDEIGEFFVRLIGKPSPSIFSTQGSGAKSSVSTAALDSSP